MQFRTHGGARAGAGRKPNVPGRPRLRHAKRPVLVARFPTDDAALTPTLRRLSVRYATANQAPEITALTVPDPEAEVLKDPKKLRLKWTATDPNEDELTYSVYARKDGWSEWVLLDEGLTKPEFEWDTTTTPAGVYRLKVVASDRPDNPDEEALTAERLSGPVVVAHEAPTVQLRVAAVEGDKAVLTADASDPLSRIAAASYSINGRKWVNVFPADGLFDDKRESFRFTTEALPSGMRGQQPQNRVTTRAASAPLRRETNRRPGRWRRRAGLRSIAALPCCNHPPPPHPWK